MNSAVAGTRKQTNPVTSSASWPGGENDSSRMFATFGLALFMARFLVPAESAALGGTLWLVVLWLCAGSVWFLAAFRTGDRPLHWDRYDAFVWMSGGGTSRGGRMRAGDGGTSAGGAEHVLGVDRGGTLSESAAALAAAAVAARADCRRGVRVVRGARRAGGVAVYRLDAGQSRAGGAVPGTQQGGIPYVAGGRSARRITARDRRDRFRR